MDIRQVLEAIAERVSAGASVKMVYAEPVTSGTRTVVPAAEVRYAFGGGGGRPKGDETPGLGAGARVSARPCGALEITPDGTRFIAYGKRRTTGIALAAGFVLGAAIAAMARPRRIEIVKRPQ